MVETPDDKCETQRTLYERNQTEVLPPRPISEESLLELAKDEDVSLITVHYSSGSKRFPMGAQQVLYRSSAPVQNCHTIGGGVTVMQWFAASGYAVTPNATGWRCVRVINIGGFDHVICFDVLA